VGRQPHPARVGQPLRVKDEDVRLAPQPLQRRQHRRPLPKGQQAGDVGERDRHLGRRRFHRGEVGEGEEHHRRPGDFVLNADVHSRHEARRRCQGNNLHLGPQAVLEGAGLGG
jgi:hypothetical protein